MKNLKVQFKLIIFFLYFINSFNILTAKNIDKFSNGKDISNYFSGILAVNDNQYQKSYDYLRSLDNLENSHYRYSQYFQYTLVALNKFKDAKNYSKELEKKNLDNFESNLISGVYYLENEELEKAQIYFKKLKNKNKPDSIQNLLASTLNAWTNTQSIESTLDFLDAEPNRFENIKKIQKAFAFCYFNSNKTDEVFRKLTSDPEINYSRYFFFHTNYLISKGYNKEAKKILKTALDFHPENIILKQLKVDLEKKKLPNSQFDCKKTSHIIAEIFYITANTLALQKNYFSSNFYLNLAKYLNPKFVSFDTLYAENFYIIGQYNEASKIYEKIKNYGSAYNWYASKQITSIIIKQNEKEKAKEYLKNNFQKLKNPSIYQIFDYAEFLKNNEKYEESIQHYSEVLTRIDKKHKLYSEVLNGRGVAYERNDQWNKAETDLLNSLNSFPNDAYVINYLAYSWIEKGINIDKSLTMLRKANELRPNDGYITDSLGWALFKLKNYKEAKKYLELAVSHMASDPVINDHYADSLWMNNNTLQARYYWNYVLKLEKTEEKLKKKIKQKLLSGLKS